MPTSTPDNRHRSVNGPEHQGQHCEEQDRTVNTESKTPVSEQGHRIIEPAVVVGTGTDRSTSTNTSDDSVRLDPAALEPTDGHSRRRSLAALAAESPLLDQNIIDDTFVDDANMPLPEADTGATENMLEVDDGDNINQSEPIYAVSQYSAVPLRFRVERFDTATINSSSRSLYSEDLEYVLENGRRYCGDCIYPNDELEQDRLRVMHQVFLHVFDLKLTSVPLDDPKYILDIGTGTGEWAIGMGETFPSCEVVGVDISPIQPTAVPHNVFFEVDDCEIEWMRPDDSVDLVHLRDMAGAFTDWDFVYSEAINCLKPGGYLEVLDFHDHTSQTSAYLSCFSPDSSIRSFSRAIDEASIKAGRRRGTHHLNVEKLQRLGFVDVRIVEHSIPLSPQSDPIAKLWLIACLHTVEAGSLRLLTKYMGWEPTEVFALCDKVCQELKTMALHPSSSTHMNVPLCILTARKPTDTERALAQSNQEDEPSPSLLVVDSNNNSNNTRQDDQGEDENAPDA